MPPTERTAMADKTPTIATTGKELSADKRFVISAELRLLKVVNNEVRATIERADKAPSTRIRLTAGSATKPTNTASMPPTERTAMADKTPTIATTGKELSADKRFVISAELRLLKVVNNEVRATIERADKAPSTRIRLTAGSATKPTNTASMPPTERTAMADKTPTIATTGKELSADKRFSILEESRVVKTVKNPPRPNVTPVRTSKMVAIPATGRAPKATKNVVTTSVERPKKVRKRNEIWSPLRVTNPCKNPVSAESGRVIR